MKPIWREIVLSIIMGMILPGIVLNWAVEERLEEKGDTISSTETTRPDDKVELTMYLRSADGTSQPMDMDEYLVGVVLAEMPADFADEARKAQAVVARTYALKAAVTGGKHGDGSVCTDAGCCQAYISEAAYAAKGGTQEAVDNARSAVYDTSGYVLTYEDELIEATYFSCSGGSTEDAVAVWGTDFPYLRATESPGEEYATHYTDSVYFTPQEFADALGFESKGSPEGWLGMVTYTAGGGVNTMYICQREYKGTELRSLLGLRSTAFTMRADDDGITVVTKGFGHRVGMSQYGADAMAVSGSNYEQILAHYYQGTKLTRWEN